MHDCYWTINTRKNWNAAIKWWQFWRKPKRIPAACDECYERRYGFRGIFTELKG
tara:strand:+ start:390 stop:551 length:162 start_codon:yes stop_codon:yes gene_type:complete